MQQATVGESYVQKGVIRHYIGKSRWSWVDIEDISAVAAECLANPEKHHGQTYRLGYEAATYDDIAAIFTCHRPALPVRGPSAGRILSQRAGGRSRAFLYEVCLR